MVRSVVQSSLGALRHEENPSSFFSPKREDRVGYYWVLTEHQSASSIRPVQLKRASEISALTGGEGSSGVLIALCACHLTITLQVEGSLYEYFDAQTHTSDSNRMPILSHISYLLSGLVPDLVE